MVSRTLSVSLSFSCWSKHGHMAIWAARGIKIKAANIVLTKSKLEDTKFLISWPSRMVDWSRGFPLLRFRDIESYAGNKTKEYDDLAMKYLSYLLYPLVACFGIYSLIYERHKSWYPWILSSLISCVYTFRFIMMCPQLFRNYKLKSVAHMPWRQMSYKFLNTIINDLFAFVIKMPTLQRLYVFRDDLVFLVYLYQRWVYPIDKKHVNEFRFGFFDFFRFLKNHSYMLQPVL